MLRFADAELDNNKIVSAVTALESRSAIFRLRRTRLFTTSQASFALIQLENEIARMTQQPLSQDVLGSAHTMVERHNLRALDALQLASALVARDLFAAPRMRFIASDHELLIAAQAENFPTWDPAV